MVMHLPPVLHLQISNFALSQVPITAVPAATSSSALVGSRFVFEQLPSLAE
jgi:hypothetical protein